jgi:predicted nucleic acid-binding Zn ribbon protein
MPVYIYQRKDGSTFELKQGIKEEALKVCPNTGQEVIRVIQPAGLNFQGQGWYVNDYGKKKTKPSKETS